MAALLFAAVAFTQAPAHAAPQVPSTRWKGTFSARMTMPAGADAEGSWPLRNYHVYVPKTLPPVGQRSLVVYLPGSSQTAIDAANSHLWNDLADDEHFIVAYPEEATCAESGNPDDGCSDGRGWSWGRAAYEARGVGEVRTIVEITKAVTAAYGINAGRVYLGGASAGAIMSTIVAATYPELYSAVGSWAGCNYFCTDAVGAQGYQRMGTRARVIPHITFAGTADYLVNMGLSETQLTGLVGMNDMADDGKNNGSVSRRATSGPTTYRTSVADLTPHPHPFKQTPGMGEYNSCLYWEDHSNSPCLAGILGWSGYPYTVTKYGYRKNPGNVVVESWFVQGMSHAYSGGTIEGTYSDPFGPDSTRAAWRFFQAHARA